MAIIINVIIWRLINWKELRSLWKAPQSLVCFQCQFTKGLGLRGFFFLHFFCSSLCKLGQGVDFGQNSNKHELYPTSECVSSLTWFCQQVRTCVSIPTDQQTRCSTWCFWKQPLHGHQDWRLWHRFWRKVLMQSWFFYPHYWCGCDEERVRDILLSETDKDKALACYVNIRWWKSLHWALQWLFTWTLYSDNLQWALHFHTSFHGLVRSFHGLGQNFAICYSILIQLS